MKIGWQKYAGLLFLAHPVQVDSLKQV